MQNRRNTHSSYFSKHENRVGNQKYRRGRNCPYILFVTPRVIIYKIYLILLLYQVIAHNYWTERESAMPHAMESILNDTLKQFKRLKQ